MIFQESLKIRLKSILKIQIHIIKNFVIMYHDEQSVSKKVIQTEMDFSSVVQGSITQQPKSITSNKQSQLDRNIYGFHSLQRQISIRKARERQSDQIIKNKWKEARCHFYRYQIQQKLRHYHIQEKYKIQIMELFIVEQQVNLSKIGELSEFRAQISQLKQLLNKMRQYFQQKQRECLPITSITTLQLNNLRVIHIEYWQKISMNRQWHYSVSAFSIFKIIHNNPLLTAVTLKGIKIQQFQQFIRLQSYLRNLQISEYKQQLRWVKYFKPSKHIQLAMNASVDFYIYQKDESFLFIDQFVFFIGLFEKLSDIIVQIKLGEWINIGDWGTTLEYLWNNIKIIKRIHIQLQGFGYQTQILNEIGAVRSILFGGLISLPELSQLSFKWLQFSELIPINDYLSLQETLAYIAQNQNITKLRLDDCENLPIFPNIPHLHSIYLQNTTFRKQLDFMSHQTNSNPYLRSIQCCNNQQQWTINECLFDILEHLFLSISCNGLITLNRFQPQKASNIKQLRITSNNIAREIMETMFPKLAYLVSLFCEDISFEAELICLIPSHQLEELAIYNNAAITDEGLKQIDIKWPYLRSIKLKYCRNLTDACLKICEFKGLLELQIEDRVLRSNKYALYDLKGKGINVRN